MPLMRTILSLLPQSLQTRLLSSYHLFLARLGALLYGNPSKNLVIIGITGTKGKSSTAEMIRAILIESGKKVAITGTIRFAIGDQEEKNLFKMSMPGRMFIQSFLARAKKAAVTHAVIEMTSEGAVQHRHRGLQMNALVFTNIAPEHIERHGSFEKYAAAKLLLVEHLSRSPKSPRIIVANGDDPYGKSFLSYTAEEKRAFNLADVEINKESAEGSEFKYKGQIFTLLLPGKFNILNALAAIETTNALGISYETAARALQTLERIPGRAERIREGQPFEVIVDYAHTPDSLRAIYEAFPMRRICVLGNTGGGRDTWKRPIMGGIADTYCDVSFLTNEDPYDENPETIIHEVASGFIHHTPHIVMDRREALRQALREAREGDAVIISGKGTDPYIMGPKNTKEPWSDANVTREELKKLLTEQR